MGARVANGRRRFWTKPCRGLLRHQTPISWRLISCPAIAPRTASVVHCPLEQGARFCGRSGGLERKKVPDMLYALLPTAGVGKHHRHHRAGQHVLDESREEGFGFEVPVMLLEQRLVGLLQFQRDLPADVVSKMRQEPRERVMASAPARHTRAREQRWGTALTSLKPFCSKRSMILDTNPRWTPSGLIMMKVRSRGILLRARARRELQNAQRAPVPARSRARPRLCPRHAAHVQKMQAAPTGSLLRAPGEPAAGFFPVNSWRHRASLPADGSEGGDSRR